MAATAGEFRAPSPGAVHRIRDRVLRALRKAGKWVDADAAAESGDGSGDELLVPAGGITVPWPITKEQQKAIDDAVKR